MTRKQRIGTFGILAVSLNLISVGVYADPPRRLHSHHSNPHHAAPAAAPVATVPSATLSNRQVRHLTPAQVTALTLEQIRALTPQNMALLNTRQRAGLSVEQIRALTAPQLARLTGGQVRTFSQDQIQAMGADVRESLNRRMSTAQRAYPAVAATPPPPPTPAPGPGAPATTEYAELSLQELRVAFMDFDAVVEGANPRNSAKLLGRIFSDCAALVEISQETTAPGCGSAVAFRVKDRGGFKECMANHIANHDACTASSCVFASSLPGAVLDLASVGSVDIQLAHLNPTGNERHENVCEDFPTALHHIDQATLTAAAAARAQANREARIETATAQVNNCHNTSEELQTAYRACGVLATMGVYRTPAECVTTQHLDRYGITILKNRARTASIDELDGVVNDLIEWANSHRSECSKALEPLELIARRQATQPVTRGGIRGGDGDDRGDRGSNDRRSGALAGYDTAIDTLQTAIDGASCLDDTGKVSEMQINLEANAATKIGELQGLYSQEFQSHYANLVNHVQENFSMNCGSWEMDPSCNAATRDFNTLGTVPQMVTAANQRQMQQNAALCQMVARSSNGMMLPPQCQQQGGMMGMQQQGFGYGGVGSSSYGFGRL